MKTKDNLAATYLSLSFSLVDTFVLSIQTSTFCPELGGDL